MRKRQSGFTLMELLATMLIAGIVIAMAVPSFARMVAGSRLADQSGDITALVSVARSEAIRRNRAVTVCRVDSAADDTCAAGAQWEFWIMRVPDPSSANPVLRRGQFATYGNTLRVRSDLTSATMTFTPDGLASNGTGSNLVNGQWFTVCTTRFRTDNQRRLTMGAASRLTIERESVTCS